LTREKLKASVRVAFNPSTTKACRRFSLLRRWAYRGELAMRRIFVDRAESMLKALATLPISMSGILGEFDDVGRHARGRGKIH
jgi:hypothetical protein